MSADLITRSREAFVRTGLVWGADILQLSYPHFLFVIISVFLELFLKTWGKVWAESCGGNRAAYGEPRVAPAAVRGCRRPPLCHR